MLARGHETKQTFMGILLKQSDVHEAKHDKQQRSKVRFQVAGGKQVVESGSRKKWTNQKRCLSDNDMNQLIERYLSRCDSDLKPQLTPRYEYKSSIKLDCARMSLENERQLYDSIGLEAPDLTNRNVVSFFKEWDGDMKWLQSHIPLKRFCCQAK